MYRYILLFLLIACFIAYCIFFKKQAKSLSFVLGVVWFSVEILTVLYKIVVWFDMEKTLLLFKNAFVMSRAIYIMQMADVLLACLSSVLLVAVLLCSYLENKKKKAVLENETENKS